MPCRNCSESGHNIRTCPLKEPELLSPSVIGCDDISLIDLDASDVLMGMEELTEETPDCMICYESVTDDSVTLKCGHIYCVSCFAQHMRVSNGCAGCRRPLCEPPKKHKSYRSLSQTQICDIVEETLNDNPGFIETVHNDLLKQTKKYISEHYQDTTTRQQCQIAIMMKNAIANTKLDFGFWLSGIHIAHHIDAHYNEQND